MVSIPPLKSRAILQVIVDQMNEGILVVDTKGIIQDCNPALERMLGYAAGELIQQPLAVLIPTDAAAAHDSYMQAFVKSGMAHIMAEGREVAGRHKGGHIVPLEVGITRVQVASQLLLVAVVRDITERKKAQDELYHSATHDQLTDLSNRMNFRVQLQRALLDAKRYKDRFFAILYCDLNKFKQVNDTLGHQVGDLLLRQVSVRLKSTIRDTDLLARFGGDEFALLAQQADEASCRLIAERMITLVDAPFEMNSKKVGVGISIGIALCPKDGQDAATLLNHADKAMYQAKAVGESAYRFYTETTPAPVVSDA